MSEAGVRFTGAGFLRQAMPAASLSRFAAAATSAICRGGDINEAVIAFRLVLRLEQVTCLPREARGGGRIASDHPVRPLGN